MGSILDKIREMEEDELAAIHNDIKQAEEKKDAQALSDANERMKAFRNRYQNEVTNNYSQERHYLPGSSKS
jgi:hypothetical protein